MKQFFTLSMATCVAMSLCAVESAPQTDILISKGSKALATSEAVSKAASRASDEFVVFYPAPEGVFYLGLPMDNKSSYVPECGVAPCNVDITFHTDINTREADYEWTYINPNGKEVDVENKDIVMNVSSLSVVDAPFLFAQGYAGRGTYTMARDGILFGQGYYEYRGDSYYASNLNVANIQSEFFNVASLGINYSEAGKNFADEYPVKISDVDIKGFGEYFGYAGAPYTMDAVRMALIYTGAVAEANQVEADIYEVNKDKELGTKLATYVNTAIYQYDKYQGSYWNTVEFGPKEGESAPVIKSPVMVVFRVNEGVETIISPTMTGTPDLPEAEPTTSYVIASYTRGGNRVENGCLPYVGELESREMMYCKHWSASAKINYDVKVSAIDAVGTDNNVEDKAVYNIMGVKVSDNGIGNLPAGIYISNGKKVLVK